MSVFTILERLAPHVEREVNLMLNSKKEAQTLKSKLERIRDGLQEAQRHGVTDKSVEDWLRQLEDLMYEMDDALDQWETMKIELQKEQSELKKLDDLWRKVPSLLVSLSSSLKHVVGRRMLVQKFKALSGRLDKILEERGRYTFVSADRGLLQLDKQESTSSVDKSKAYGRKSDNDSLVRLLLSSRGDGPLVVSVVGIEGLGKTTLAQLVFNDDVVDKHFGRLKAWVSVPDPFDPLRVARAILATFDRSFTGDSTLEILGQRIKAIAAGNNFLLVLDNLRRVDRAKWEPLKNFFVGQTGFKILVTTSDAIAARTIGTTEFPRLNLLSDSDCAKILTTIALKDQTEGEKHKEFLEIGFDIAKKCNGLPLAAKTIGHALETRSTTKEWRDLLGSPLWICEDEMSDIFRPLSLSYMDLSPLLKPCFLSSVLYSKGFKFDSEGLIRIWRAQGYLESTSDWDQVVAKGEKYLRSLSERSFFQVFGRNDEGSLTYILHDILFDFARNLSKRKYYFTVDGRTDKRPYHVASGGKIRYFCARFVSRKDLPRNLFKLLKRARVLCLSDCDFEEFSKDLGKLTHLRYLDLSGNLMKELPETVTNLHNLETLDLRRCRNLIKLPRGLKKMIKLRHLLISDTESLLEFDEDLRKLSGLWTVDKLPATRDSSVNPNQLRDSVRRERSFTCLRLLQCFRAFNDGAETKYLNELGEDETLKHMPTIQGSAGGPAAAACFKEMLEQEKRNDADEIAESSAGKAQDWNRDLSLKVPPTVMASKYLNNVRTLAVKGSEYPRLPRLKNLPMLVTLRIQKMNFRALTPEFFVGGFPKLETLTFSECKLWKEWEDLEEGAGIIFPRLNYLAITLCPKLEALPHRLLRASTSLQELFVAGCPLIAAAYGKEMGGENSDQISQIPNTIILSDY